MKKLLFIAAIALVSCQKKRCYICVTEPYPPTQSIYTPITESKCEFTGKDARNYEMQHTTANARCTCTSE